MVEMRSRESGGGGWEMEKTPLCIYTHKQSLSPYIYLHIYALLGNVNDLLTESMDYAKYAGRKVRRAKEGE